MSDVQLVVEKVEAAGQFVAERLETALRTVAEKAGVGVDHFWPVLVNQVLIEGVMLVAVPLVVWVAMLTILTYTASQLRKHDNKASASSSRFNSDEEARHVRYWVFFLGIAVVALFSAFGLPQILNPEYVALKSILQAVR